MKRVPEREEAVPAETAVEPLEPRSRRTTPARQRLRRRTGSGDRALDEKIAALVKTVDAKDPDLLAQIIETSFRMARTANRGEMKLVSRSFRELARAFRIFAPYRDRQKVSIFGSARTMDAHAEYAATRDFAALMAARGWMVITGAGPGIMAAGHEGAGKENSFGVGIKLPFEQTANPFIAGDPKLIDFKYFFTRKIMFMKESDAVVLLPGGFGTLDEAFELLTLVQTGKAAIRPIVLMQPHGSTYWTEWAAFVGEHLGERGFISDVDMALFDTADSPAAAVACIERFYANYHSARYVGEQLVIRVRREPRREQLQRLNVEFADIVARGRITPTRATPAEVKDNDCVDLARITFLPVANFGRIRQLIDALNAL